MVRRNILPEAAANYEAAFVREMYTEVDALRLSLFDRLFAEDATFNFGDAPQVKTVPLIKEQFAPFFSSLTTLEHVFTGEDVSVVEGKIYVTSVCNYHFKNDFKTSVKLVTIVHKEPGTTKINGLELFGNFGPVFEQVMKIQSEAATAKGGA